MRRSSSRFGFLGQGLPAEFSEGGGQGRDHGLGVGVLAVFLVEVSPQGEELACGLLVAGLGLLPERGVQRGLGGLLLLDGVLLGLLGRGGLCLLGGLTRFGGLLANEGVQRGLTRGGAGVLEFAPRLGELGGVVVERVGQGGEEALPAGGLLFLLPEDATVPGELGHAALLVDHGHDVPAGQHLDTDENLAPIPLTAAEIDAAIDDGTITDGKTIILWHLYKRKHPSP